MSSQAIVSPEKFAEAVKYIWEQPFVSLDFEATGLHPYLEDEMFSLAMSAGDWDFYFNFNNTPDHLGVLHKPLLPREWYPRIFANINKNDAVFIHNAKYDGALSLREGVDYFDHPNLKVHCTMAGARVEYNDRLNFSLDFLAREVGSKKIDAVKKYIVDNKLYNGKTKDTGMRFDLVPMPLMSEYAMMDARICLKIGLKQINKVKVTVPSLSPVMGMEKQLTKTAYKMERTGIKIDRSYCEEARTFEYQHCEEIKASFLEYTGVPFVDSSKCFAPIFDRLSLHYPLTDKGNPSFSKDALETVESPLVAMIKGHRKSYMMANTFYSNLLKLSDHDDVIHANIKQGGTIHGRMSYGDPNLQNIPKRGQEKSQFPVRRAFVPRPGYKLVMIDYDQMEYRLMLDYAGEMQVIKQVLAGVDVHTATADLMKVERDLAKTINFLLIYGGGLAVLAMKLFKTHLTERMLKDIAKCLFYEQNSEIVIQRKLLLSMDDVRHGCELLTKTRDLRELYYDKLPNVAKFIKDVTRQAETRGYIFNWNKRRCYFRNKKNAYKAPNYLISGGCADVVKIAMNRIDDFLTSNNLTSRMLVQIHDELLFEVHESEMDIICKIKDIMENVYRPRFLPLTAGVDYSENNWQDKNEYKLQ